jgi:two-component system, OmpR family, response regulator TctD
VALVLIVEDEEHLATGIKFNLELEGYEVDVVADGTLALERLVPASGEPPAYDLVILDVMLPGTDGFAVAARMREASNYTPILMLTAKSLPDDVVHGLEVGADDYLPKPFDLAELVARLRAIARRRVGRAHAVFECGRLRYDTVSRIFSVDGHALSLPPREHGVLELLVAQPGSPVSKQVLCDRLCTLDEAISPEAIDIYIHRLRKRLEGAGMRIRTLRGLGYLLEAGGDAPA